jgi:hypothetical protein
MNDVLECLSDEKKKLIRDKRDYPLIAFIDDLSESERSILSKAIIIKPEYNEEFGKLQGPWFETYQWFWGEKHNKDPRACPDEFLSDYRASPEGARYRIYYSAHNLERIEIIHPSISTLELLTKAAWIAEATNLIPV